MAAKKVLFLTLKVFSFTGGIEKVCRTICRSLYDLSQEGIVEANVNCMYDENFDRDSRYLKKHQFHGFNEKRKRFVIKSLFKGIRSDVVLLSHVHLLSIGYLIKRFSPNTKVYLIAHGIEIWRKLPDAKLKALKRLDKIIAVSHFTAEKIKEIHGIDPEKIEILNNSLDPFYYFPSNFNKPKSLLTRYGLNEDHQVLLSLCRLSSSEKYKGYDNTMAIIPNLIKKNPNLIYLIAGKPDEEERHRIENLITKLQIKKYVKLIGFVDEAEISDHFLLSDIFVLPSKKEGFGIVFIEALASGLNVVAGDKDGSVDALQNGALGKLVNPDDMNEIEITLGKLLASPLNNEQKIELQNKVFNAFNYEKYCKSIKELIFNGTTIIS
ncbi:glycosyltransferase family 4 protein [Pedobacter polaris]|uniref:Glycosyltransferase family 4 protein n=1 Tax=Pedobacter polaris TaxID=2571273 RepID=A0A4U1CNC4_9SPHI|nr:glycosyltransferase family 4 protein [Pedobacter polaris]TKC08193.1 glycosyltransferase family 4 protein [Pedobacter polaris]